MSDFQFQIDQITSELQSAEAGNNFTRQDLLAFRTATSRIRGVTGGIQGFINVPLSAERLSASPTLSKLNELSTARNRKNSAASGRQRNPSAVRSGIRASDVEFDRVLLLAESELDKREALSESLAAVQASADAEVITPIPDVDPETGIPFALSPAEVEQRESDDIAFSEAKAEIDLIAKDENATPEQRDAADEAANFVDNLLIGRLNEELDRSEAARDLLLAQQVASEEAQVETRAEQQRLSIAQRLGISPATPDPFASAAKREKDERGRDTATLGRGNRLGSSILGG